MVANRRRAHPTMPGRIFQGTHYCGPDRDRPSTPATRAGDGRRRRTGMRYGSSTGAADRDSDHRWRRCRRHASRWRTDPVAAQAASIPQSQRNPAEGGSKATGGPAMGVHTSQTLGGGNVGILDGTAVPGIPPRWHRPGLRNARQAGADDRAADRPTAESGPS